MLPAPPQGNDGESAFGTPRIPRSHVARSPSSQHSHTTKLPASAPWLFSNSPARQALVQPAGHSSVRTERFTNVPHVTQLGPGGVPEQGTAGAACRPVRGRPGFLPPPCLAMISPLFRALLKISKEIRRKQKLATSAMVTENTHYSFRSSQTTVSAVHSGLERCRDKTGSHGGLRLAERQLLDSRLCKPERGRQVSPAGGATTQLRGPGQSSAAVTLLQASGAEGSGRGSPTCMVKASELIHPTALSTEGAPCAHTVTVNAT